MWYFGRMPNNPPLEQRTIEPPLKWLSIHPLSTNQDSLLQCVGSTCLTWKHHLPRELALTELIHRSHHDITGAHHLRSTFQGFIHLDNFELGSDTTCKDSGHHISPQWYDIVHFGPKPSWICFWDLPQKASYQWRYLSILMYPWSSPLLVNVGLWSYTQQFLLHSALNPYLPIPVDMGLDYHKTSSPNILTKSAAMRFTYDPDSNIASIFVLLTCIFVWKSLVISFSS